MKLFFAFTLATTILLAPNCPAQDWQSLWKNYAAKFMDNQIRVIDHDAGDRTTSEGQAYAMFFALVANDRSRFDRLLHWTEANLASGDLTTHLPAWSWGKGPGGKWAVLDSNSASDADLWTAYTLLQAGKAWNDPHYTTLGTAVAKEIAAEETVELPGFGMMLIPGPKGFRDGDAYRLNASYLPVQLLLYLAGAIPQSPWRQIASRVPGLIASSSPGGFVSDWSEFRPGKGVAPAAAGSYDAIRVYLWAGLLDSASPGRAEILKALPGMARVLRTNPVPPARVKQDATVLDPKGPVGFSAALLPYLAALGENRLENEQLSRLQSEFKNGLYGNPPRYYDQNLAMFALGWRDRHFWFDPQGGLHTAWQK